MLYIHSKIFIQPTALYDIRAKENLIHLLKNFRPPFITMSVSPANQSETINVSDSRTITNVNMTNVTKLNSTNYIMWSRQVHALFDGYDLAGISIIKT